MKIVKNKVKEGNYYFITYEMDQSFSVAGKTAGLLLLYTIADSSALAVDKIVLDFYGGIQEGKTRKIYDRTGFQNAYPSFDEFCRKIDVENLAPWTVELQDGTVVNGGQDREIRLMYKHENVKWIRFFLNIEMETYHYNDCPKKLMEYLEDTEGMSEPLAVEVLQRLEEYKDLYQEFSSCIQDGKYIFPEDPVSVEGYTARRLVEEVGFHPIGAYRSLAWLRNDPQTEMEKIKQGLIWK